MNSIQWLNTVWPSAALALKACYCHRNCEVSRSRVANNVPVTYHIITLIFEGDLSCCARLIDRDSGAQRNWLP